MSKSEYKSEGFEKLSSIEHIRKYPSMYLASSGELGVFQTVKEVVANSIDECMAGYGNLISVSIFPDNVISVLDYGRGIPVDINPKYGETAMEMAVQVNSGGKYDKKNYNSSFGLFGVGLGATNCVSKFMSVRVWKNGKIHYMETSKGHKTFPKKKGELKIEGDCPKDRTGTEITWQLDPEVMSVVTFDIGKIISFLKTAAFLNSGITFRFEDHRDKKDVKVQEFLSENGLVDFVSDIRGERDSILPKTILYKGDLSGSDKFEIAFTYTKDYKNEVHLYVNRNLVPNGGTPIVGFRMGLTKAINDIAKLLGILKDRDKPFKTADTDEGLIAIINLTMSEPEYEG